MHTTRFTLLTTLAALLLIQAGCTARFKALSFPDWLHSSIDSVLEGTSYGTACFTLDDFDRDGDLDITISRREIEGGKVFWYENTMKNWIKHSLGISDDRQLGAVSTDINEDGFPDLVVSRFWFENPGVLATSPDAPWARHTYSDLKGENHDIIARDINRDNRAEIICYSQTAGDGTLRVYYTHDPGNWTYVAYQEFYSIRRYSSFAYILQKKPGHGIKGRAFPGHTRLQPGQL